MNNLRKSKKIPITLVGKNVMITNSNDPSLKGIKGKVVGESKNMIIIKNQSNLIKISKKIITIMLEDEGYQNKIEGSNLLGTPEARIKKIMRRK
jgi:RNase P/RNase MRP subunit p29